MFKTCAGILDNITTHSSAGENTLLHVSYSCTNMRAERFPLDSQCKMIMPARLIRKYKHKRCLKRVLCSWVFYRDSCKIFV